MGLFSGISTTSQASGVSLIPAEAFAAITVATVAADGYLSDEEAQVIMASLTRMELFRNYPRNVMRRLFDKLCGITKRYGSNRLIRIGIASLPLHLHNTAFVVAADLVLADGELTQEEENTLVYLYTQLDISDEKATNILDAIIIKNKG